MRQWIRSHLTYANVMATLAVFLVLGGGTALASYVISSNSQVGPNTISGHHTSGNAHPNLIAGSVGSKDVADDGLTGADIKEGTLTNGQVRQFAQSTNSSSDSTPLLSFHGISLARSSNVSSGGGGPQLLCKVSVSGNVAGRYDGYVVSGPNPDSPGTLMRTGSTPVSNDPFGNIGPSNSGLFHITFVNLQTDQVVNIDYSIVGLPSNGGCRWQGTAYAAG
jgi:hypothetical protein